MRQMITPLSRKNKTSFVTGKSAVISVKHKMSLFDMSTMITSRRIARTLPVTGRAVQGNGNPSKPSTCWLYICEGTLVKNHINAM